MLLMLSRGEVGSCIVVHGVMLAEVRGRGGEDRGARFSAFEGVGHDSAACGAEQVFKLWGDRYTMTRCGAGAWVVVAEVKGRQLQQGWVGSWGI